METRVRIPAGSPCRVRPAWPRTAAFQAANAGSTPAHDATAAVFGRRPALRTQGQQVRTLSRLLREIRPMAGPRSYKPETRVRFPHLVLFAVMVQRNGRPPVTGKARVQLPVMALRRGIPTGRGSRFRNGLLWVRVPSPVPRPCSPTAEAAASKTAKWGFESPWGHDRVSAMWFFWLWVCNTMPWHRPRRGSFWISAAAEVTLCSCGRQWITNHAMAATIPYDAETKAFYARMKP